MDRKTEAQKLDRKTETQKMDRKTDTQKMEHKTDTQNINSTYIGRSENHFFCAFACGSFLNRNFKKHYCFHERFQQVNILPRKHKN